MRPLLFLLFFAFSLSSFSQVEIVRKLSFLGDDGNDMQPKSFCTDEYWNAKYNSGKDMISQFIRKDLSVQMLNQEVNEDRAVMESIVIRANQEVDVIFLYLLKQEGKWFLDGLDKVKDRGPYFLDGRIRGYFHPESLPEYTEAKEFIQTVFTEMNSQAEAKSNFLARMKGAEASKVPGILESAQSSGILTSHYAENLKRGSITLFYNVKEGEEMAQKFITLYLKEIDTDVKTWEVFYLSDYEGTTPRLFFQ